MKAKTFWAILALSFLVLTSEAIYQLRNNPQARISTYLIISRTFAKTGS